MTFIASVVAKNGVALIADSLVTTTRMTMDLRTFQKYVDSKRVDAEDNIQLVPEELNKLFRQQPSHTKDYEEKLFQIDQYTAVTTAGNAEINGKRIYKIIEGYLRKIEEDPLYNGKDVLGRRKCLCDYLEVEAREHLTTNPALDSTTFIYTHYDHITAQTHLSRIFVGPCSKENLSDPDFKIVNCLDALEIEKVVCHGQNKISEKILFGNLLTFNSVLTNIVERVLEDFNINQELVPENYIQTLAQYDNIGSYAIDGMKIIELSELSLQEAVELANLLMRIEIDFQMYTENIPTVGGVIKIAIIDKNGFKFISGHEITKPNHI